LTVFNEVLESMNGLVFWMRVCTTKVDDERASRMEERPHL